MTQEERKKAMAEFADLIEKGIAQGIPHTTITWVLDNGSACSIGTAWLASGRTLHPYSSDLIKAFPFLDEDYSNNSPKKRQMIDHISFLDNEEGREGVIKWLREQVSQQE